MNPQVVDIFTVFHIFFTEFPRSSSFSLHYWDWFYFSTVEIFLFFLSTCFFCTIVTFCLWYSWFFAAEFPQNNFDSRTNNRNLSTHSTNNKQKLTLFISFSLCYCLWLIFTVDVHSLTANDSTKHTLLRRTKYSSVFWQFAVPRFGGLSHAMYVCAIVSLVLLLSHLFFRKKWTATQQQSLFTVKHTCCYWIVKNTMSGDLWWATSGGDWLKFRLLSSTVLFSIVNWNHFPKDFDTNWLQLSIRSNRISGDSVGLLWFTASFALILLTYGICTGFRKSQI